MMVLRLTVLSAVCSSHSRKPRLPFRSGATARIRMAMSETASKSKVMDSHLHVWASPQEVT